MLRRRRRLDQLEQEVAEAKATQADLQRRLALFEKIAAAAGAAEADREQTAPLQPVPPSLLAAAADASQSGSPVRLAVGGAEVIAVIGDEGGDPSEWWAAIHRLATRLRNAS